MTTQSSNTPLLDPSHQTFQEFDHDVGQRLALNQPIRRNLPGEGRLRIDRQLPFLVLYRSPVDQPDVGTLELVTTEASYLFIPAKEEYHEGVSHLIQSIRAVMREHFGTFLLMELWSNPDEQGLAQTSPHRPAFEIIVPDGDEIPSTVNVLREALQEITVNGYQAEVSTRMHKKPNPPERLPLNLHCPEAGHPSAGCFGLGLAVKPIYRDFHTGVLYPMVLQSLRWQLSTALRKAVARFTNSGDAKESSHFQTLGPSSFVKAARLIDQQLGEISESFDFLLQVTPINSDACWERFQERDFQIEPTFRYRPLPYHPNILKRRLFNIQIERVEDPTLAHLFWEKQDEIDRQLSALRDLGRPDFLYGSLQLFGEPQPELVRLAEDILEATPESVDVDYEAQDMVSPDDLLMKAREEIDYYHTRMSEFSANVEICDDIASGIMVSRDRLLVSESLRLAPARLEPILHHEIGTHLLTYFNGRCQPFRQLYAGLSGYQELQEGLAVLAEYLVGGLTPQRLRQLAARVWTVHRMVRGQPFVETFHELHHDYQMSARSAFMTSVRAYRGGGLTKDIIYLRGLRDLLLYLAAGHDIEPLYVGKIGLHHVPYIQEMRRRGLIKAPRAMPRLWDDPLVRERLEACRSLTVLQLLEPFS